ncbi:MAG: DEAD/DEAH box helicase [Clostridiales bacterium]|nr:DEAD/DEAH box helicase [Clostridiales bacterium]
MDFQQTGLMQTLLKAVEASGYEEPTPIQRETIPLVLQKNDVLGCAQTGTGKTAAFALPILQRLWERRQETVGKRPIRALVLTPTRELALQIFENFQSYGKGLSLRSCVIFGGVPQRSQVDQLNRGVDILVATPGRLNDLIGQGYINLRWLEIFVLDEADRMLDMGFIHDVRKVITLLPIQRQTLLFSATMPQEVEKLAIGILHEPISVKVDPVSSTVDSIEQSLFLVDKVNKKHLLAFLLRKPEVANALVFTRTKHGADRVVRELGKDGIIAKAIHGDKSQNARQEALGQFKDGKISVLVATDIAARGIDISGLSHVINYDLPNEPEAYVHRIGRTGRAGLAGTAISFCCFDELKDLKSIEKLIGFTIPREDSAWPMEVFTETVKQPRPPRSGRSVQPVLMQNTVADKGQAKPPRFGPTPTGNFSRQTAQAINAPMVSHSRKTGTAQPTPSSNSSRSKRRKRRGDGQALPPQLKGTPLL